MSERLWEYGEYWIGRAAGTPKLYIYWYDKRSRATRRRSSGTEILAEAREELIKLAGSARVDASRDPGRVMILSALDHYFENDAKLKPSRDPAERAIVIVRDFLVERMGMTAVVSSFGPIRQREFMAWCREKLTHSPSTIARNLSVVSAAFRYGRKVHVVTDGLGNQSEVQLLDTAPDVVTQAKEVARLLNVAAPKPRDWLPTYAELGRFIDAIDKRKENLFRFVILAMNTWARPTTITDFRVAGQVNREFGILDLNPPGRPQTAKYRPKIKLTDNLRGWLNEWEDDAPLTWDGQPLTTMKRTFKRHAEDCGLPLFTQDTLRHFMATHVRRVKPAPSMEQRDVWLGHVRPRTANWYESFDPEFLEDCQRATEEVIARVQAETKRPLFACKLRANEPVGSEISVREMEKSVA